MTINPVHVSKRSTHWLHTHTNKITIPLVPSWVNNAKKNTIFFPPKRQLHKLGGTRDWTRHPSYHTNGTCHSTTWSITSTKNIIVLLVPIGVNDEIKIKSFFHQRENSTTYGDRGLNSTATPPRHLDRPLHLLVDYNKQQQTCATGYHRVYSRR